MPDARIPAPEPTPAEAFSALPLETPERSAWPLLAARIDARPRAMPRRSTRQRWLLGVAAAAALCAIALLPRDVVAPAGPATAVPADVAATRPASADTLPLDALMAESARLEYLIGVVDDGAVGSAAATALALDYEARVQQLDVALSDPGLTPDQRAALWQRRVDLLREYAGVNGTAQWLAAQGRDFDGDLVAVF